MLPEIVTFNKSMQYRLEEYEQLLGDVETPCSEVVEIWGSTFKDLATIGVGWHALWVLSEENCKRYDLLYPTAVIVQVDDFNWCELTASIKVIAVQEDIVIPSAMEVPVIQLHPVKIQDYDETELQDIEDWLDKCRYFFKNLWYPWDAKINVSMMDWCESHLRNRLKMQYDIKNGLFDKNIANYLKLLLAEAQSITAISETDLSEEDDRLTAVRRYIRRKIIKTELDLFEEPDLRYGMILLKWKEKHLRNSSEDSEVQQVKFVWMSGSCKSFKHYLKVTESIIDDNAELKVFVSLQDALDSSSTTDTVILPPGVHVMTSLRGIENGGFIKGLEKHESLIVPDSSAIPKAILFECFGCIELENLTISKLSGIVLQVFDGVVKLKKCRIISTENQSTSRGVVVVSGCKLFIDECELHGFGTAIALQGNTHASIIGTKIDNCYEGIKVTENVSLSLQNVVISSCSTCGIKIESSQVDSSFMVIDDLSPLKKFNLNCNIEATSVTFKNNGRGNIVVKQNEPSLNLDQSLKSDTSNEVISLSDNEEHEKNSVEEIQIMFNNVLNCGGHKSLPAHKILNSVTVIIHLTLGDMQSKSNVTKSKFEEMYIFWKETGTKNFYGIQQVTTKENELTKYEMLKKGGNPDYTDVAYREAVSRLRYLLNEPYVPPPSKYPNESDEESGISFVVTDRTRTARLSPYKRPLIPQRFHNKHAVSYGDDAKEGSNVPVGSHELVAFIEKQEEYIDQLEKEAQYCRDELSQLLNKVKELISENESLQEQQKSGLMKVMFGGLDEERLGDHQNPERYRTRLEGPLIVFESRISELEAQLTQSKIDLRKAQEEAEMYKKKLEDCQPSSSNYDFYKQIENLQREKRDLNESLAKLQASINQIREKEMDASKKVQRTLDVVDKTQLEKQQAEMEVYRLKNELELQHDKLLEVLSEQTRKVADERNQAERRYLQHVERLNTELTLQRDAFSKLQMEVDKHIRVEEDLKRDLAAKNITIENVKKELNNKIASLQAELSAALSDRDSLEQELNTSRMSGERTERLTKQETNRLQVELSALRQRLDRGDAELIHCRRENLRLLEQISTLEKELTLYKIKLGEKKDPIEEEEQQVKEKLLNSRISEIEARHVKTVSDLEGLIENQSQVMAQLKAECQSLTQKLEESAAHHKEEMDNLQSKLNSLTNKMNADNTIRQWSIGEGLKDKNSAQETHHKKVFEDTTHAYGADNENYGDLYSEEISHVNSAPVFEDPVVQNIGNSNNQQSFQSIKTNILDDTLHFDDNYRNEREDSKKEDHHSPFAIQSDYMNYGNLQQTPNYNEEQSAQQQQQQQQPSYQEHSYQEQAPSYQDQPYKEQISAVQEQPFEEQTSRYQEQQGAQEQFFYQEPAFKERVSTEESYQGYSDIPQEPAFVPLTEPPAVAPPEPKLPAEVPKPNTSQRFQRAAELSRQASKSEDTPRGKVTSQTRIRTTQSSRNQQKAPQSRFK